ncbi:MAG: hypothetical protein WAO19_01225 [Candidatus Kryptoniota bacterium]
MPRNERAKRRKEISLFVLIIVLIFPGCQKLSSIPTSEDNFIIVPPAGLAVYFAGDASILVYWGPVNAVGFSFYKVYFSTDSAKLNYIGETTDNSFFIDSLSYDSTYYFRITADYENGIESGPSNYVHAQPVNLSYPAMPLGLSVQGHNDGYGKYMTVIWSANTDGDLGGYEIYRDTSGTFQPDTLSFKNLAAVLKINSFKDTTNLLLDEEYYYKVIAFDFARWRSVPSQSANDMILEKPVLIFPSDGATISYYSGLTFDFKQVQGATGYIFYVSSSINGGDIYTSTITPDQDSIAFSGSSLNPNQLYFWHVAATTIDQNTPNSVSDVFSFTITQ